MKIKKSSIISFAIVTVCFLTLFLIGTFYDLEISKKLVDLESGNYYSKNFFGAFFEIIGETPIYWLSVFAGGIIFYNAKRREKSWITIVFMILGLAASVGMATYLVSRLFKYSSQHFGFEHLLGGTSDFICYLLLGGCITFVVFYFMRKVPSVFFNRMIVWAFVFFAVVVTQRLCTSTLKSLASRPRYRAMFMLQDFDMFKRWYEFQAKPEILEDWKNLYGATSDWFKSFPSGHSSAAATVIALTYIPSMFEKTNNIKVKAIVISASVLYTLLVMLSRIVVGAHFLTDVCMGAYITYLCFLLCNAIAKLVMKKLKITPLQENSKPIIVEESI